MQPYYDIVQKAIVEARTKRHVNDMKKMSDQK